MNHEEGTLATDDGLALYWQSWTPPGEPEGVLLFVHGLAEHSGRYLNPVRHFVARGWACYGFDYRGHGRSPGQRVHVGSFDEYLSDLGDGHRLVRIRHPELRVFIVGHSQGGLLTLLYAGTQPANLTGVIASSPFLGIHPDSRPSSVLMAASRVLSRLAPRMTFPSKADPELLSRDSGVAEAYRSDPLVSDKVSARWATSALEAQRRALEEAHELAVPALVMQAGADRIADPEATRSWVAAAPGNVVEYVEWEGYFHELFNEPLADRRPVFDAMERWLAAHRE
jgi:alpha-beta hydrolase superfamily lysophospholipase